MAYTPINWQTGDTITAEKMNKMDNGWGVETTQLFGETVTTVAGEYGNEAELTYANPIIADPITVTFDGNEYTCPVVSMSGAEHGYGGVDSSWTYDFSQYPFAIVTNEMNGQNTFATHTAGTYTVAVSAGTVATSDNFDQAVSISAEPLLSTLPTPYTVTIGTTTLREVFNALASGKIPIATHTDSMQNTPRYIEIFLYARTYNLTASSILLSDGALTVKNYTATNANSPIYEAE